LFRQLSDISLNRTFPTELSLSLKVLYLDRCGLYGTIPSQLGLLATLTYMSMDGNNFTGEIPSELGQLNSLQRMWEISSVVGGFCSIFCNRSLAGNSLNGTISEEIGALSSLSELSIDRNQFSGTLPRSLIERSDLKLLRVYSNNFTGTIALNSTFKSASACNLQSNYSDKLTIWNCFVSIIIHQSSPLSLLTTPCVGLLDSAAPLCMFCRDCNEPSTWLSANTDKAATHDHTAYSFGHKVERRQPNGWLC
jgi:hypothetical protein